MSRNKPDYYMEHFSGGLRFLRSRILDEIKGVEHFFTVKSSCGQDKNMGLHVAKDKLETIANRREALEAYGMDFSRLVVAKQVHGNRVQVVTSDDAGRGATKYENGIDDTDSLVTTESKLPLMTFFADCVPIFIVSRKAQVIGIVHSGWKGISKKNPAVTIRRMCQLKDVRPNNLVAVIGPSIGACCYTVGKDVVSSFYKQGLEQYIQVRQNRYYADLAGSVKHILLETGIPENSIRNWDICTYCNPDWFHSYRRDGKTSGRMAGVLQKK